MGNNSSHAGQPQVQARTQANLPVSQEPTKEQIDSDVKKFANARGLNADALVVFAASDPNWQTRLQDIQFRYNRSGSDPQWSENKSEPYDQKSADENIKAFALKNGLNWGILLQASGGDADWMILNYEKTIRNYNDERDRLAAKDIKIKRYPDEPRAMHAPTLRAARQCYCLACKRKVTPVGARIVGNRCCGTCPLCRRKVCTFVAKTQAGKHRPTKKRVPVKKRPI